ncbi:MAG: hypothetical protein ACT4NV_15715 [Rhodoferax sp.]
MNAVLYAFLGTLLIGITMPLWLPVLRGLLELFSVVCEIVARFEGWRAARHRAAHR